MKHYRARARWVETVSGRTGEYTEPEGFTSLWEDEECFPAGINDFQWAENSYSCQCNRARFFEDFEDINCGGEVLDAAYEPTGERRNYLIQRLEALDWQGQVVYTWPEPYEVLR
jgi:hypothetical protein